MRAVEIFRSVNGKAAGVAFHGSARAALFSLENLVRIEVGGNDHMVLGLKRVVELEGEEIFGIDQFFDDSGKDVFAERDQIVELFEMRDSPRIGTNNDLGRLPSSLPGFEQPLETSRQLRRQFSGLFFDRGNLFLRRHDQLELPSSLRIHQTLLFCR